MRKSFSRITVLLIVVSIFSSCAVIYKAPQFPQRASQHKVLALTPLDVTIQYRKLPQGTTIETIKENEKDLGYTFQDQLYTRFLKRLDLYTIDFQDIDKTNSILIKNNISYENLKEYSKEDIAKLLGVDVILSGKILTQKPMSTGGAIALGVLTGLYGSTNKVEVSVTVHDGLDSKLLWKYEHTYSGSVGSSPESISKALFRNLSNKFPYRAATAY